METEVLLLQRSDVSRLLSLSACIDAMEQAFRLRAAGLALPPELMHVDADGGEFHIKGGGLRADPTFFALKANGGFFANRATNGLPNILGLILLFDGTNGRPLAVMDSITVTTLRTAATTALAARYLARPDARCVTVCGCGTQGRSQLAALQLVLPQLRTAFAWSPSGTRAAAFAAEMSAALQIEVIPVARPADGTLQSDVIVTCTPARAGFLQPQDVRAGTFIAAVGADSPDKQELAPQLLAQSTLVVDILEQCATVGELHHALAAGLMTRDAVHAELADLVVGRVVGRTSADEVTIFDTTGSAIQDTAAALHVYRQALAGGVGTRFDPYR